MITNRSLPVLCATVFVLCFVDISAVLAQSKPEHPFLEKDTVLSLLPGENNPRNSEGAFVTLRNGDIMFVYTRYVGTSASDHAPASLAARISTDRGKTWSKTDREIVANEGKMNVMSVSLLRLLDGRIALIYLRKNSNVDCCPCIRFSSDEGENWSEPIDCVTDETAYYVLNNDRVMQQEDGTLLMPLGLHRNDGGFQPGAEIYCYISKDSGLTWQRQQQVPNPDNLVLQEPGLVQLDPKTILMYIRSNAGCQCYSRSQDNGATWSPVEKSPLIAPLSPAAVKKIPGSDDLLAIWNHDTKERNPFNIAILDPTAKIIKWEKTLDFSADASHWFCYPSLHFIGENEFLTSYCSGMKAKYGLDATTVIKSTLENVRN